MVTTRARALCGPKQPVLRTTLASDLRTRWGHTKLQRGTGPPAGQNGRDLGGHTRLQPGPGTRLAPCNVTWLWALNLKLDRTALTRRTMAAAVDANFLGTSPRPLCCYPTRPRQEGSYKQFQDEYDAGPTIQSKCITRCSWEALGGCLGTSEGRRTSREIIRTPSKTPPGASSGARGPRYGSGSLGMLLGRLLEVSLKPFPGLLGTVWGPLLDLFVASWGPAGGLGGPLGAQCSKFQVEFPF